MIALTRELARLKDDGITEVGFVDGAADPSDVATFAAAVTREFGIDLPEEYRSFISKYGRVGVQSSSIFGIDLRLPDEGDPDQCGLVYRNRELASHPYLRRFFILGEDDFCLYGIDRNTGDFVQVGKGEQVVETAFESCDEMLVKVVDWMINGLQH